MVDFNRGNRALAAFNNQQTLDAQIRTSDQNLEAAAFELAGARTQAEQAAGIDAAQRAHFATDPSKYAQALAATPGGGGLAAKASQTDQAKREKQQEAAVTALASGQPELAAYLAKQAGWDVPPAMMQDSRGAKSLLLAKEFGYDPQESARYIAAYRQTGNWRAAFDAVGPPARKPDWKEAEIETAFGRVMARIDYASGRVEPLRMTNADTSNPTGQSGMVRAAAPDVTYEWRQGRTSGGSPIWQRFDSNGNIVETAATPPANTVLVQTSDGILPVDKTDTSASGRNSLANVRGKTPWVAPNFSIVRASDGSGGARAGSFDTRTGATTVAADAPALEQDPKWRYTMNKDGTVTATNERTGESHRMTRTNTPVKIWNTITGQMETEGGLAPWEEVVTQYQPPVRRHSNPTLTDAANIMRIAEPIAKQRATEHGRVNPDLYTKYLAEELANAQARVLGQDPAVAPPAPPAAPSGQGVYLAPITGPDDPLWVNAPVGAKFIHPNGRIVEKIEAE